MTEERIVVGKTEMADRARELSVPSTTTTTSKSPSWPEPVREWRQRERVESFSRQGMTTESSIDKRDGLRPMGRSPSEKMIE